MMESKGGLGKGLSALFENKNVDVKSISESDKNGLKSATFEIDIGRIRTNPFQPREDFDESKLKELADSIRQRGVIQPVTVKTSKTEEGYILISGERRVRAAKLAGLTKIPAFIYDVSDESKENMIELALIENIQRDDLNPMELSDTYQTLADECGLTQEQIALKVSKQRSTVANFLRLQRLPVDIKVSLRKNEITEGHARMILRLDNVPAQIDLWKRILKDDMSVRQLEEVTKKHSKPRKKKEGKSKPKETDPYLESLSNKLRTYFGTRVTIKGKTKQTGEIIIEYYSNDDLERILEIIDKQQ